MCPIAFPTDVQMKNDVMQHSREMRNNIARQRRQQKYVQNTCEDKRSTFVYAFVLSANGLQSSNSRNASIQQRPGSSYSVNRGQSPLRRGKGATNKQLDSTTKRVGSGSGIGSQ